MKISIDTKEDSHEEIKKVIKMLQNLVGDSQEIFTNQPISESTSQEIVKETETEETPQSTEDLFAELFSEEELKKMNETEIKEEEEIKTKDKGYSIELY